MNDDLSGIHDVGDGNKIIGHRYFFAGAPLSPVLVVAVRGDSGQDWAAYTGGLHTYGAPTPELMEIVFRWGCKLTDRQAAGLFPDIVGLRYRP